MRLVLHINNFSWPGARSGPTLAEIGSIADECGFDRIGVADYVQWLLAGLHLSPIARRPRT
jgi:hypothetical protein